MLIHYAEIHCYYDDDKTSFVISAAPYLEKIISEVKEALCRLGCTNKQQRYWVIQSNIKKEQISEFNTMLAMIAECHMYNIKPGINRPRHV